MSGKALFKVSSALTYKEWSFSLAHMYPASVLLTKDKLTCKWLGFIPFIQIKTKDITSVRITNNEWVHFGLSNIFFAVMGALKITYSKGNKIKNVYIVLSDKNLGILSKLIRKEINKNEKKN